MSSAVSTTLEASGSTNLVEDGINYFLQPNSGSAVKLSYAGAPVVDGQFDQFGGHWVPIGAEQTATGFEVAWKITGADQYTVWYTDNSGNYVSSVFDVATGSSATLQSLETSFQQDLNGDGWIGLPPPPPPTVIESFGSTSLVAGGSNYFLDPNGGSAVALSYGGAPVVAGQFDQFGGHWVPIGAEQTANGFEVAWEITGADQYAIWYTDSSGNYLSSVFDDAAGSSAVLQSFETSFEQDLNGDDSIGLAPPLPAAVIEDFGSTALVEDGSFYYLQPHGGSAAALSYGGAPVVDGQFDQFGGHWVPIGAEQTATGFEVAWKIAGADQYTVWNTDNSGNYLSSAFDVASGTSTPLQSFETIFHQDLNGDGYLGLVLNGSSGGQTLTAGSSPTTLIGGPNDILNGGGAADTFVFKPNFGANTVNNFVPGTDELEFSQSMFSTVPEVLNDAQQVGSDVVITHDPQNVVTLHNMQLSSLLASDVHIF
jgi:20S proteasome alpha/beta subunit